MQNPTDSPTNQLVHTRIGGRRNSRNRGKNSLHIQPSDLKHNVLFGNYGHYFNVRNFVTPNNDEFKVLKQSTVSFPAMNSQQLRESNNIARNDYESSKQQLNNLNKSHTASFLGNKTRGRSQESHHVKSSKQARNIESNMNQLLGVSSIKAARLESLKGLNAQFKSTLHNSSPDTNLHLNSAME